MKSSLSAQGLNISIAFEHFRSSSASRADINSPGPAFGYPGSASIFLGQHILPRPALGFLGLAYLCPGRHIYVLADICGPKVDLAFPWLAYMFSGRNSHLRAGMQHIRPLLASINSFWAIPGQSRPADVAAKPIPAWAVALKPGLGSSHQSRCRLGRPAANAGWASVFSFPAGPGSRHRSSLGRPPCQLGWATVG
jgi:hypothetical protein